MWSACSEESSLVSRGRVPPGKFQWREARQVFQRAGREACAGIRAKPDFTAHPDGQLMSGVVGRHLSLRPPIYACALAQPVPVLPVHRKPLQSPVRDRVAPSGEVYAVRLRLRARVGPRRCAPPASYAAGSARVVERVARGLDRGEHLARFRPAPPRAINQRREARRQGGE
jgi:hypothetical protein